MSIIMIDRAIPEVTFDSTAGVGQRLSDLRGKTAILYFYPKDNTSGCTCEAEEFRNNYDKFQKHNCVILGISRDSLGSHRKIYLKIESNPLRWLATKTKRSVSYLTSSNPKPCMVKRSGESSAVTFLIHANGILRREWRGVKAEGHLLPQFWRH